jgi:hypothetical protein
MALPVVKEEPLMEADDAYGPEKRAATQQLNVDPVSLVILGADVSLTVLMQRQEQ